MGQPLQIGVEKKRQATRKRLGMHVLLIDVEERNSEKKIRSILGMEKENRGRKEGVLLERPSKRWTKNCSRSSERGDNVWSEEVVIKVIRSHCSTRMDETNVLWTIRMLA
jgi:hypothetical protein